MKRLRKGRRGTDVGIIKSRNSTDAEIPGHRQKRRKLLDIDTCKQPQRSAVVRWTLHIFCDVVEVSGPSEWSVNILECVANVFITERSNVHFRDEQAEHGNSMKRDHPGSNSVLL